MVNHKKLHIMYYMQYCIANCYKHSDNTILTGSELY